MRNPPIHLCPVQRETQLYLLGTEPEPSKDLLEMLGCLTYQTLETFAVGTLAPPDDPETAKACLSVVTRTMLSRLERGSASYSSVLNGMLYHCVEDLPTSEQHAYEIATLALLFSETYVSDYDLDTHVAKELCRVLNAWVKPEELFMDVPGVGVLARALFGDAWRCLFVPDHLENSVGHSLFADKLFIFTGDIAFEQRPPFLPGLCPGQAGQTALILPDNVGPAL